MTVINVAESNLELRFEIEKEKPVLLTYFGLRGKGDTVRKHQTCRIVEIGTPGEKNYSFRGNKNFYDCPQLSLGYTGHEISENEHGKRLVFTQRSREKNLRVTSYIQLFTGTSAIRSWTEIKNEGEAPFWLEQVTSFCYGNLGNDCRESGEKLEICIAKNTWSAECCWSRGTLKQLGVEQYGNLCYDRIHIHNASGLSSEEYLPMGIAGNVDRGEYFAWQIENNGAWAWEIGAVVDGYAEPFMERDYVQDESVYLQLSGPRLEECHWQKCLRPGEVFCSVPAAVAISPGGADDALTELNCYRRRIRQKRIEQEYVMQKGMPVIYNDYMNGLMGDSCTELLLPLIGKAAAVGCEVFVVDCGWYSKDKWEFSFGKYEESRERYPGGLTEVMEVIKCKGMIPGIWLELESYGIDCPGAEELPKEWLFQHRGIPVIDSGRYHLDFRCEAVCTWAEQIVDRVIAKYKLGYLKIDYNLCSGLGTDREADSLGDGLLSHNRAYLAWLEKIVEKYPDVIFENCGSGGLRMDYALLSRMDIQSVSDQEDFRRMGKIAAASASAVLPEQAGIWSYPRPENTSDEVIFNMVSSILFCVHLGGRLEELKDEDIDLIKKAIDIHKSLRADIGKALPVTGIFSGEQCGSYWYCMEEENAVYAAVWHIGEAEASCSVRTGPVKAARMIYPPLEYAGKCGLKETEEGVRVSFDRPVFACLIKAEKEKGVSRRTDG